MNGVLLDAFRHNTWATKHLLTFCRGLSEQQLKSPDPAIGTTRDILELFDHIVLAEGSYLGRLAGRAPAWVEREQSNGLAELEAWVDELSEQWEAYLARPVDAERVYVIDDGAEEVRAGIIIAQVPHHGSVHREQISAIVTGLGIEPPDLQPWEYAWASGRIWKRSSAD